MTLPPNGPVPRPDAALRTLEAPPPATGSAAAIGQLSPQRRALLARMLVERHARAGGATTIPVQPRTGDPTVLPCSPGQQRLWLAHQLTPDSPVHNAVLGLRLIGDLDVDALTAALNAIVARHEALRTTFAERDGEPHQVIGAPWPVPVRAVDLRANEAGGAGAAMRAARKLAAQAAARPFDLTRGPLLRVDLYRIGDDEHLMLLTVAHIVTDGWSHGIIMRELGEHYAAIRRGHNLDLPPLPLQYADVAVWQRAALTGAAVEDRVRYFADRLHPLPTPAVLPVTGRPAASGRAPGAKYEFPLATEVVDRLAALTTPATTPFSALMGAFGALLARYAGSGDVTVGTLYAGRPHSETEGIVGYFVNTLVLRTQFDLGTGLRDAVGRAGVTTAEALARSDVPFDELLRRLDPDRDPNRLPLFNVAFLINNAPAREADHDGLRIEFTDVDFDDVAFDLALTATPTAAGYRMVFEYSTDLFDRDSVARIAEHLRTMIDAGLASPDTPLVDLDLLHASERSQVVPAPPVALAADRPLVTELISARIRTTSDAVAIVDGDRTLTYAELGERAARLAAQLPPEPGTRIGVCLDRSADLVVAIVAVLLSGGTYVPASVTAPAGRTRAQFADAGVATVLADEAGERIGAPPGTPILRADRDLPDAPWTPPPINPAGIAYVIYTSGSTGEPKGVEVTHANLAAAAYGWAAAYRLDGSERHLQMASPAFDVFTGDLVRALCYGGRLVLCPTETLLDPVGLAALVHRERVTTAEFVPVVLRGLVAHLQATGGRLDTMRLLIVGSDLWYGADHRALSALAGPHTRLVNSYGVTEATVDSTYFEGGADGIADDAVVPIGRALPGVLTYVLDPTGQPCPLGVPGELYLGGPGVAAGYRGRPELTAQRFVVNPFAPGRLYRTGDRAIRRADGLLELHGRLDDQVKVRGLRVEPGEVAAVVRQFPGVGEVAVVDDLGPDGNRRLVAYLTGDADPARLRTFLADRLADAMVPAAFVRLDALPMTVSGKVDRRTLPKPTDADRVTTGHVEPSTPTQLRIAGIFAELLGVTGVGAADDFFHLGGHSLLAARAAARIRAALCVDLPLRTLFEHSTVAGLAAVVDRLGSGETAAPDVIGRRAGTGPVPMLPVQRRMWFLEQLEPGHATYHVPEVLRLRGPLDTDALRRAWADLVARHEALRTVFRLVGDEPRQVLADVDATMTLLCATGDQDAQRRITDLVRRPFDLAEGPLWRAALIEVSGEYILVLVLHHAIADGWSFGVLLTELAARYAGAELPAPGIGLHDVAAWQQDRPDGAALGYWRTALAGAANRLDLPADRPRPEVASAAGDGFVFDLDPAVAAGVRALARAEGATEFMTLLSAYAALLARLSGQDDLLVGSPVAGRGRPELESVVGCLLDTAVLRIRPEAGLTFRDLVRQVRATALDAYAHPIPLDRLVEDLRPERSLDHAPLFQVLFSVENTPDAALRLPGVTVSEVGYSLASAKADLSLTMAGTGDGGLRGVISYRSDLFDRATVERSMDQLRYLLAAAAAAPDTDVHALPLGPAGAEPGAPAQVPPDEPSLTVRPVHHTFEAQALRTPDAEALVAGAERITYGELNARANQLAGWLRERGAGPGVLVAIVADRSVSMVVSLLAVWKAGAAYVAVDPLYPPARSTALLERAAPLLILTGSDWPAAVDVSTLDLSGYPAHDPAPAADPDGLAYVVHTSGSTGLPKGVCTPHRGVANYLAFIVREYGLSPRDTVLQIAGLGFDASVRDLIGPLTAGARVVLLDPDESKDPAAMLAQVRRHGVTGLLSVVPTLLRALAETGAGTTPADTVRLVLASGEKLVRADVVATRSLFGPHVRLVNQYGPTECTMTSTFFDADPGMAGTAVPVGRPIPGSVVRVLDAAGVPVPPGVVGEIYIGGIGVADGYLDDPAQTADRFVYRPGVTGRLYRTGDLGRWRSGGVLELLGRVDHQIKVRGIRVDPGEVEAVLRENPHVADAVVTGHGEPARLVAYLVGDPDAEAVREYARERLPDHLVPAGVVLIDALPRTANGKVDRNALPAPVFTMPRSAFVAPEGETEQAVAHAWAQVLGISEVGASDNFFDLGGDSFSAVKVVRQIGRGMRVIDLFRHPTVRSLAAALQRGDADTSLLVRLTPPGAGPEVRTLVCVPYAGGNPSSFVPLAKAMPAGHAVLGLAVDGVRLSVEDLAAAAAAEIMRTVTGPVALYGHCSGTAVAVAIARRLEDLGREVSCVYAAAAFPNARPPGRLFKWLSLDRWATDRTYHTFFRSIGGFGSDLTPAEVQQIVRNLRHDSQASEDYFTRTVHDPDHRPLRAPLVCIVGDRDPLTEYHTERVREWERFASDVRLAVLERAGHYYVKHRAEDLATIITAPPSTADQDPEVAPAAAPTGRKPGVGIFALVAAAQYVSITGSGLTGFALGVWTYLRTGSVTMFALISVCALVPGIIAGPFAGAVVDRVERRKVMLWADLGAGLSPLALAALLAAHRLDTWHIYVVLGWASLCGAFQRPAYLSAVPQLIPKRYLTRANGVVQGAEALGQLIAPLLGGVLVVAIGLAGVIAIDVVTFAVAVVTVALVRFPNSLPWRRREPVLAEVTGGWRFIAARPGVMVLLAHAALTNLFLAAAGVLVTPLVLTGDRNSTALGLVLAAGGTGGVLGGLAMALWGGPRRLMSGILGFCVVTGASIMVMGVSGSLAWPLIGMFGDLLTLALGNGCYTALIQVKVPHHLHGRVFALNQMIAFSTMPLGFLLAGPLVDHVAPVGPAMVGLGAAVTVVTLAGYLVGPLWKLEEQVTDAEPDADLAAGGAR